MTLQVTSRGQYDFPVESGHLTQCTLNGERGNPGRFLATGRMAAMSNNGLRGVGDQKKRRPYCNDVDTSLNITRHDSAQTSGWSLMAR